MKKTNTTTTATTENILTYSANPFCEFDKKTNLQQEHTQEEFEGIKEALKNNFTYARKNNDFDLFNENVDFCNDFNNYYSDFKINEIVLRFKDDRKNLIEFICKNEFMNEWIYANKFKLNAGIVRAITIPELKTVMYKVLTEVDSIAEQFKNTNLEAGQRITIVKYSDFGMMSVSKVTFHSYEIGQYAQYDNSVKMTFKPHRKKGLYYKWFYGDVIIYNGWYDLPDTVLFDISYKEHCITQKSKWASFDRKQYDAILEYFAEQGLKPIINTYKPVF